MMLFGCDQMMPFSFNRLRLASLLGDRTEHPPLFLLLRNLSFFNNRDRLVSTVFIGMLLRLPEAMQQPALYPNQITKQDACKAELMVQTGKCNR